AAGARLIAVPGWPLPTFCTASAARTRAVSTARWSNSVHSRSVVVGCVLTLSQGSSPHGFGYRWPPTGVVEPTPVGHAFFQVIPECGHLIGSAFRLESFRIRQMNTEPLIRVLNRAGRRTSEGSAQHEPTPAN